MLREVQPLHAAPRWPADGERFREGRDDVAAPARLDALHGCSADAAVERAVAAG